MPRRETNEEWRRRMQESIDRNKAATESGRPMEGRKVFGPPQPEPPQLPRRRARLEQAAPSEPQPPKLRKKVPPRDPYKVAVLNLKKFEAIMRDFLATNTRPLPLFVAVLENKSGGNKQRLYSVFIVSEDEWLLTWPGNLAGKSPSNGLWFTRRFDGNDRGVFTRLLLHKQEEWL